MSKRPKPTKAEAIRRKMAKRTKPAPRTLTEADLAAIRQIMWDAIALSRQGGSLITYTLPKTSRGGCG